MRDAETTDELRAHGLRIIQPLDGYRFSIDPLLLCDFACAESGRLSESSGCSKIVRSLHPQKDPRRRSSATPHKAAFEDGDEMAVFQQPVIIDLGTGCGIIPQVLARQMPGASLVGVELQEEMAGLASRNVALNGLDERIRIICADVLFLRKLFPVSSFDLVTANPPYRKPGTGRVSPKAGRDLARHESTASLADFLAVAKYLVKPSGAICFISHPSRLAEFIHCAVQLNLSLLRLRMVHGSAAAPATMFLAQLAKGRKGDTTVLGPLFVHNEQGGYSDEVARILGES